ncbi:MAG: hypothetical protein ACK5SQ_14565 [Chitinophagales bacterium]|jgi:prefoldin subunit 5
MYLKLISTLLLTSLLLACNDRKEVTALQTETEYIHDEAMKLMGPMNALVRDLKKELAEIDSTSARFDTIQQTILFAKQAESDMMEWMKNYKAPTESVSKEEAISYLNQQKTAIEKNAQDLQEATNRAKSLIEIR